MPISHLPVRVRCKGLFILILAASQDLAYPRTQGERPADLEESRQYFAEVDTLTAEDVEVHRLVVEVLNLAKPLSTLREEPLWRRVEARRRCR